MLEGWAATRCAWARAIALRTTRRPRRGQSSQVPRRFCASGNHPALPARELVPDTLTSLNYPRAARPSGIHGSTRSGSEPGAEHLCPALHSEAQTLAASLHNGSAVSVVDCGHMEQQGLALGPSAFRWECPAHIRQHAAGAMLAAARPRAAVSATFTGAIVSIGIFSWAAAVALRRQAGEELGQRRAWEPATFPPGTRGRAGSRRSAASPTPST